MAQLQQAEQDNYYTKVPKSIRTGKRVDDPSVTNIRAVRYVPDGKFVYKLRRRKQRRKSSQSKRKYRRRSME
ncbi:hypothetical protein TNCV_3468171 [Trichonephila clavipes]|nr:hypothetical protein TNCV_3468171 [Trichonephila clavipes]